jgi:hypothetical protein
VVGRGRDQLVTHRPLENADHPAHTLVNDLAGKPGADHRLPHALELERGELGRGQRAVEASDGADRALVLGHLHRLAAVVPAVPDFGVVEEPEHQFGDRQAGGGRRSGRGAAW